MTRKTAPSVFNDLVSPGYTRHDTIRPGRPPRYDRYVVVTDSTLYAAGAKELRFWGIHGKYPIDVIYRRPADGWTVAVCAGISPARVFAELLNGEEFSEYSQDGVNWARQTV